MKNLEKKLDSIESTAICAIETENKEAFEVLMKVGALDIKRLNNLLAIAKEHGNEEYVKIVDDSLKAKREVLGHVLEHHNSY